MSALGQNADIVMRLRDVRFTPESGHVQCNLACPLSAKSRHVRYTGACRFSNEADVARRRFLKGDGLRFAHLPARPAGQDDSARSALLIV